MSFAPLPYQRAVCEHLKAYEPGLWRWFMSDDFSGEAAEESKLELLKSCYRMTRDSHAQLYQTADDVAEALGATAPITLYQSQSGVSEPNAALYFFTDELCVVFSGPILDLLSPEEVRAVIGHEFSHHRLYLLDQGAYFAAARLLSWCAAQPDCHDAYVETARRFQLHTELYADLGAAVACDAPDPAIASLIKIGTGLKEVVVEDYLAQTSEILSRDSAGAKGLTHPEVWIRANALSTAAESPDRYSQLVRGPLDVGNLDVLDQRELSALTKQVVQTLCNDTRFRGESQHLLLREYYPSFEWSDAQGENSTPATPESLAAQVTSLSESSRDYLAYVLLDVTTADRDDSHPLLGASLAFSQVVGLFAEYETKARKDLKLKKADIKQALEEEQARSNSND